MLKLAPWPYGHQDSHPSPPPSDHYITSKLYALRTKSVPEFRHGHVVEGLEVGKERVGVQRVQHAVRPGGRALEIVAVGAHCELEGGREADGHLVEALGKGGVNRVLVTRG